VEIETFRWKCVEDDADLSICPLDEFNSTTNEGASMADIRIEEKSRKGLPNWLLILLVITVAIVAWWYITQVA